MKRALLAPLALLAVLSLPLAGAHPVCQAIDNVSTFACAPTWGDLKPTCDAAVGAVNGAGDEAAATCEDLL